jgi:hydrophobic/amphiphilic exporter-1 (mainly G- bacteria), HAE1 family
VQLGSASSFVSSPGQPPRLEVTLFVDFFIRRPIFATVCALLIVLAGAVCIPNLPISLYPTLAPPQVVVTSVYIGANSKDVESAVTTILEESINGVEGMNYMSSTSSNDGTSAITVTFQTGYDLNIAAVDVQNRVASVQGRLPAVVNNTGITITKANSNFVLAAGFISPDKSLSPAFISNYIDVYIKDALKRVPGVGDVIIFGERKYAMRLWLDPSRLAARGLTALDVTNALTEQNVEVAAGQLGQQPSDPHQAFQMAVRAVGRLTDPRQFENIVIKNSTNGGGIVLVKDVGRAEIGAETYDTSLKFSGSTFEGGDAVGVGVLQLSNANALDVDKRCRAVLAELEKSYPPGLQGVIAVDTTLVIGESVDEVVRTIGEAIIIVIIVIFLFLQDWRATIIPAVTIPVSLIGTFAFIKIFGFSINSLTLFGITLATGLVVDDAIVVIENVQRHLSGSAIVPERSELTEPDPYAPDVLEHARSTGSGRGMETVSADAHEATSIAMAEVTSAVIATSLVLISVFIPVSFFPGTTGILYKQFSLTIAFSIAISAFNALTLSPALAAILLRAEAKKTGIMGFFLNPVERLIQWVIRVYARAVTFVVRIRYVMLVIFLCALAATAFMYNHVPTAFIPQEDQSYFLIIVQTPPGASLSYTSDFADKVSAVVRKNDGIFGTFSVMGFSLAGGSSPNSGLIFAPLKPINDRTKMGEQYTAKAIVADVGPKLFGVPGGIAFAAEPPAVAGIGTVGGFQFILQDSGRNTFGDIDRVAHTLVGQGRAPGSGLTGMNTTFTSNDPQLLIAIDRQKAKAMGVSFSQITAALNTFMGSSYVNDFDFNNRSYRVYVQADAPYRRNAQDLRQYYVRSDSGQMVPLDNLASITETSGPQVINHYNIFRSAEIDGSPAPGLSSGQGLDAMVRLFDKNKMPGMSYSWTGLALEEVESAGKAIIIFGLGLLVVYLTLSAQYESFALPFIILLAVPMAILGALTLVDLRGLVDDVYVQIGLVMLIGLSAKNSILIVEFAEQLLEQGRSVIEAAIEAAELRLRPILMTSIAFILGVGPLYFATGAGAYGRHSVGTAIVGGMVLSTILNLFFIPVLYVILKTILVRFSGKAKLPSGRTELPPAQPTH